jgi:hypothetical protein
MKSFITTLTTSVFLFAAAAQAQEHNHQEHNHGPMADNSASTGIEGAACEDTVLVKVNGLVCDFCARALEKVFGQREEVSGITVDLDKGVVSIAMKPGQTIDNETLTGLITDSGYNVTSIDKGC